MPLKIIGAGMAGLLAANMLRHHDPLVIEAAPSLPNNHSAVLRFRSSIIGDVLGINFKKVRMIKAPLPWMNPVADALAYSRKSGGLMRSDRSITDGLVVQDRYIAPSNLIELMARNVNISFSAIYDFPKSTEKVISTIPMPQLMSALDYPLEKRPQFIGVNGINVRATIPNCDAYVSVLVPNPRHAFSRISITGNELIVEMPDCQLPVEEFEIAVSACRLLGLPTIPIDARAIEQKYAKIFPIAERERKNFIYWASTLQGRAFQLGRFATWRPGLLLDDLVKDIRLIDSWIRSDTPLYDQEQHEAKRI